MSSPRESRLLADQDALARLQASSTIFACEPHGAPPDRYTLTFRGRGLTRALGSQAEPEWVDLHQCDLRLPYAYPARPPDIRWLTPLFHPNVSFSGVLTLDDLGLAWEPELGLDAVCERLWDTARFAWLDPERAANFAAKHWLAQQPGLEFPTDVRPLRDLAPRTNSNVVRYRRRGQGADPHAAERLRLETPEILYIGEDTLPPPAPSGDVLYIGE